MENSIYEWLYDYYAEPELRQSPELQQQEALLELVPEEQQSDHADALERLCMHWGTAAFEAGVRLGMGLLAPYVRGVTAPDRSSAP